MFSTNTMCSNIPIAPCSPYTPFPSLSALQFPFHACESLPLTGRSPCTWLSLHHCASSTVCSCRPLLDTDQSIRCLPSYITLISLFRLVAGADALRTYRIWWRQDRSIRRAYRRVSTGAYWPLCADYVWAGCWRMRQLLGVNRYVGLELRAPG
jgi:hypothetical protein